MTPANPPPCPQDSESTPGAEAPAPGVSLDVEASSRRLHYLALAHLLATFGGANSDARPDASAPADSDIERAR